MRAAQTTKTMESLVGQRESLSSSKRRVPKSSMCMSLLRDLPPKAIPSKLSSVVATSLLRKLTMMRTITKMRS